MDAARYTKSLAGHCRFPANPNGQNASASRFLLFSALKRLGSNLWKKFWTVIKGERNLKGGVGRENCPFRFHYPGEDGGKGSVFASSLLASFVVIFIMQE